MYYQILVNWNIKNKIRQKYRRKYEEKSKYGKKYKEKKKDLSNLTIAQTIDFSINGLSTSG